MNGATALLVSALRVAGLALLGSAAPWRRQPPLAARLDPYLHGLRPLRTRLLQHDEAPLTPLPTVERLLRPLLAEGARLAERWLGGNGSAAVARRLREAGCPASLPPMASPHPPAWQADGPSSAVLRFRAEQVLWGLAGFVAGSALALLLGAVARRGVAPVALVGGAAVGALGGVLGRDWWLGQQIQRRQARMLSEFPTLADLLCLSVVAGESPRAAIERAVLRARGELSRELWGVLADLRAGMPFAAAMERLAARVPIPQVTRFVDGLVVAVERGTPLADVLRAQAADVREQRKRELLEAGGKKEIYMLIPVVFLILPVVVLFALYPGFFSLNQLAR